jgi:hypothetical protein
VFTLYHPEYNQQFSHFYHHVYGAVLNMDSRPLHAVVPSGKKKKATQLTL